MDESRQYIDTLNKEYIENHLKEQERFLLLSENNVEIRDIKGYHGREILELLQNADDAYQKSIDKGQKPPKDLEVLIQYENNILTISNTGTHFDKKGILAILQGNNSDKKNGKYIGNKGTGFRSILNWAENIRIHSSPFNLEFSKKIAADKFESIRFEPQVIKQLNAKPNLYIPILAMPRVIESIDSQFDTTIQIVVDPEKTKDGFGVIEQIQNIDLRLLLFLPNINKITTIIKTPEIDEKIVYAREIINEKTTSIFRNEVVERNRNIRLFKMINDTAIEDESYHSFDKVIPNAIEEDEEKKDIRLSIAIPDDFENFEPGHLYSFFPLLETKSPFRCVMHASYALGDQRDTLSTGSVNKKIVQEQLLFLKQVAQQFSKAKYGDLALSLLTPIGFDKYIDRGNWKFTSFSKFGLEDFYFSILKDAKILQSVNSEFISIEDSPKMFEKSVPSVFVGINFSKILKTFSDELVSMGSLNLVNKVAKISNINLKYNEIELEKMVNGVADSWSIEEQVEVFVWWNSVFSNTLPCLMKKQNEEWLELNDECYFLIGNVNEGLPSWVKVPALKRIYQERLFEATATNSRILEIRKVDKETPIERLITKNDIYPLVDFAYRDKSNIITTVNSSVAGNYNKAKGFVQWLWGNYRNESDDWTPPRGNTSPIKYNLPNSSTKQVSSGNSLYFGESYGFNLSDKLFNENFGEFPSSKELNIQTELDEFINFISKFGVNRYPKIETREVDPIDSYKEHYIKKIISSGTVQDRRDYLSIKFKLPYIDQLDKIIQNLSTLEVISWIHSDVSLRSILGARYYFDDATISYIGYKQQNYRNYKDKKKNYVLAIFNSAKWVEIDGHKYAPIEILKGMNSRNNNKFSGIVPVIDINSLEEIAKGLKIDYEDVIEILDMFNFCDEVTDLSSDKFYDLMLKLPEIEFSKSTNLSKIIYRIIEKTGFTKKYEDSSSKDKYFEDGMLLVKYHEKLTYHPANKSYLPSSKIVSKKNVPILDKGQRTNNDNFIRLFGCQEYNKDYSIDKRSIVINSSNDEFQDYFKDFSRYARAYNEDNTNLATNSAKLKITLVSKIIIVENNQLIEISEEYLSLRDTLTNWYITVKADSFDLNLVSEQIENIFSNIANTPGFNAGKFGELFRTSDNENREFLIRKEFGTLDVIADDFYSNQVKNNFVGSVQKIDETFDVAATEIDFDDFFGVDNSPAIIKTLKSIETDLDGLTDNGFVYRIDLVPYYKAKLRSILNQTDTQSKYKNYKFNLALKNVVLQDKFLQDYYDFINFEIQDYENSIYFDSKIEDRLLTHFGNWIVQLDDQLDAADEYTKNFKNLNPKNLFIEDITNSNEAQTYIYFNREDELKAWFQAIKIKEEREAKNDSQSMYSAFWNVIPEEEQVTYHEASKGKKTDGKTHGGSYTPKFSKWKNKNLKVFGNKGELLVYNKLVSEVGKEKVYPKSEAFEMLGILTPGQGSSGKYDLSFEKDGKEYFVEVKSSSNGRSFLISSGELEFAKENPSSFLLYLVKIDNEYPEKSKIVQLPLEFWKNKKFRKKDIIETIEFEF